MSKNGNLFLEKEEKIKFGDIHYFKSSQFLIVYLKV